MQTDSVSVADEWVCQGITGDITSLELEMKTAVLVCDNETLIKR